MREGLRFPPKVFQREDLLSRLPQLRGLFSREGVTAAYLFGSVLNGQAQPGSDLDIAIQGEQEYEWSEFYGRVYKGLCELLQADNIDLVILNEAPASPRIRAQREGFPLYIREDESLLPGFVQPPDEVSPYSFSDWIAALLAVRKVMVHLLWKLEGDSSAVENMTTFTDCFSRVLSYLDFALG